MRNWLLSISVFLAFAASAQDAVAIKTDSVQSDFRGRKRLIGAASVAGYGGSFLFLSQAWYKDYPRSGFHTFNDSGEWLQVDKVGHAWTAYQTSRVTTELWRWAGVPRNKALLYGAGSSLLYMFSIEYLDGRSAEWGWSWSDVAANVFGASLYAGQELAWKEQKVSLKFSSHFSAYKDPVLQKRADALFGSSFQGRLLKDYNAQTYWLSANLKAFLPKSSLPNWLNVALGYGASGMFGGYENVAYNKTDGTVTFDRRDVKRIRQWYLAPDVDFTKIKTKSKFLRTILSAANVLKFPAPALELSNGRLRLKAVAF